MKNTAIFGHNNICTRFVIVGLFYHGIELPYLLRKRPIHKPIEVCTSIVVQDNVHKYL